MITKGLLNGHQVLWLENEQVKLAILPEKGADVPLLYHQHSGIQFLMQTPHGLLPPGDKPQVEFLENYEGGWQELFPSCGGGCVVNGISIPMHGEVALAAWDYELVGEDEVRLWVACQQMPFRLDRRMRLQGDRLQMDEQVTNTGQVEWPFVWGQHVVLGGDFLEEGCRLEMPASHIATPTEQYEPATSRLADDQWEAWSLARGRQPGGWFDLSHIDGAQVHKQDDAFITGFTRGHLDVTNPRLRLRFSLDWDAAVFPWLTLWMPYGGAELPPLTESYGVGIEPWFYRGNLTEAIEAGKALRLGAGKTFRTAWSIQTCVLDR